MKHHAPATERNREPIAAALREVLPASGTVLEVASGSGEHAVAFAELFAHLRWQPSDADPTALASICAWAQEAALPNLLEPVQLNAADGDWPVESADALLCVNMVHISPWSATEGLMRGAGRVLGSGAPLILYGPYSRSGLPTAPSNEAFDKSLRARNPLWGLRLLDDLVGEAQLRGLRLEQVVEMPANNLTLVFRKS